MKRVSSSMQHTDANRALRLQESRLHKVNNQIATQKRIQELRDDPVAAGHAVRYKSYVNRLNQFEKNAKAVRDQYQIAEGYMTSAMAVLQRARELAVTGANGTLSQDDVKNIVPEVNQLLAELLSNANAIGPDGTRVFAGTKSFTAPFEIVLSTLNGEEVISDVRYNGSITPKRVEGDELAYLDASIAGNTVFWAERQSLFSPTDARAFVVEKDSAIEVNGQSISLIEGDNVYSIISKINNSGAGVRAYLDPITNGLNMETTSARQLWLSDVKDGSVLAQLGLIKSGQRPPYNFETGVRVSGGSAFDSIIALRNALATYDQESVGGKVLGGIDGAIDTLAASMAENGSRYARSDAVLARLDSQIPNVTAAEAREADVDFTKAATDLKLYEYTYQATLSTVSKLYKDSLLDYLR